MTFSMGIIIGFILCYLISTLEIDLMKNETATVGIDKDKEKARTRLQQAFAVLKKQRDQWALQAAGDALGPIELCKMLKANDEEIQNIMEGK